ncbi:NADPH-dependent methylglyoxal reductase GRE2-like isoform X3 [Acanthaster planci]|uniref:NADPH-dependent methylglyoxal reductase GRE2-like isoform X1 n=2 Tax=Acanthaster planci TaxID=133434 RepID=A0A8B7XV83_ACAPL|nr:NADPH-dependent methylglyoxal reductase GRE2-like isoform X1 [Acanthaster planci]XP_022084152.1 NADPH-dependent methylglyoxal reductase GRE2-like isoform X3 [Acanthaster planci]
MESSGEHHDETRERVLVTGASGFVASHVVQQLLQTEYNVRGTVRSLSNETKVKHLKSMCGNSRSPLELVEADLMNQESWISAVKDCRYVLHIASPFPVSSPKDESELIIPAVDGTKNVLEACAKTPTVKRVVLTSSVVAVADFSKVSEKAACESDWPDVDVLDPYSKSKMLAEKAAWSFVEELKSRGDPTFELAVINPGYVMGPVISGTSCTSMEVVKRLMCRDPPLIPKMNFSVADVRDVAASHIAAMTHPEAPGQRFIVTSGNIWMSDMSQVLNEEFHDQGYRPAQMKVPHFFFKMFAKFDSTANRIAPMWGKETVFDNSKMKNILKIEPHPLKQTIVDMAYSMIDGGFLKKSPRYKGQSATAVSTDADDHKSNP